jgi:hypothetical protein
VVTRVVVLDLVVVPDDVPAGRRVRRLQVRIGAVQRVAVAVAGEVGRLRPVVAADGLALPDRVGAALVDVVAQEDEGVQLRRSDVPVGRVELVS